jgi:hypothetical protein
MLNVDMREDPDEAEVIEFLNSEEKFVTSSSFSFPRGEG